MLPCCICQDSAMLSLHMCPKHLRSLVLALGTSHVPHCTELYSSCGCTGCTAHLGMSAQPEAALAGRACCLRN